MGSERRANDWSEALGLEYLVINHILQAPLSFVLFLF